LKKVARFSSPKNDRQLTALMTHFTIVSPQKNHALHALFAKTPLKKPSKYSETPVAPGFHFF
jgi:hypothetical protein